MPKFMITYFISDTCGCGCDNNHHKHAEHEHIESSEGKIISKIKSLGAWAHFMPEGFLIKCDLTADKILSELKSVANLGDILFVTEINDEKCCACSNEAVINWISE